jgi:hypothetical protein
LGARVVGGAAPARRATHGAWHGARLAAAAAYTARTARGSAAGVRGAERRHTDVARACACLRLPQQRVHERRLAVVDVRNDGDVAHVLARLRAAGGRHGRRCAAARRAQPSAGQKATATTQRGLCRKNGSCARRAPRRARRARGHARSAMAARTGAAPRRVAARAAGAGSAAPARAALRAASGEDATAAAAGGDARRTPPRRDASGRQVAAHAFSACILKGSGKERHAARRESLLQAAQTCRCADRPMPTHALFGAVRAAGARAVPLYRRRRGTHA